MSGPRLQIQIPQKADGEVDWTTLGSTLTTHIIEEVSQASYVDYKYGCKSRELQAATDWKFLYEEHDVVVFRKQFSDSPINAWLGRCVINLPLKEVAEFVNSLDTRKYWDKYLSEIRIEKYISDIDFIYYLHLEAKQCLVKQHRDFVYYERIAYVEGKCVRSCLSVDLPDLPPVPGITRAQMLPGTGWVLEPYGDNKTLVNFLAHTDLKKLPPLIVNRAIRRSPMCVYHVREFLTNPVYRKKHEKVRSFEGSNDTFTDSDLAYVNAQSLENRFLAEEQLSVYDFLSDRPNLKRNKSEPLNLDSPFEQDRDPSRSLKYRSYTHVDWPSRSRDSLLSTHTEHSASAASSGVQTEFAAWSESNLSSSTSKSISSCSHGETAEKEQFDFAPEHEDRNEEQCSPYATQGDRGDEVFSKGFSL